MMDTDPLPDFLELRNPLYSRSPLAESMPLHRSDIHTLRWVVSTGPGGCIVDDHADYPSLHRLVVAGLVTLLAVPYDQGGWRATVTTKGMDTIRYNASYRGRSGSFRVLPSGG